MTKSTLRKGFIGVLAGVLLVSGGYAVKTALDFQAEKEIYQEAQVSVVTVLPAEVPLADVPVSTAQDEILTIPEGDVPLAATPDSQQAEVEEAPVEEAPLVISLTPEIAVNFDGLNQVNEDIVAWLHIPNSTISYPVLQGEDNQGYLDTTYDGRYSVIGSIFMDYRISGDFTDRNTIIYGHNVSSGAMFGSLSSYRVASYAAQHPYFFVLTPEGYLRYEVCYAIVTTATSDVYNLDFTQEGSFQSHLDMLANIALYDMGVSVTHQDQLVTLSTCTGVTRDERFVIIGRLDS